MHKAKILRLYLDNDLQKEKDEREANFLLLCLDGRREETKYNLLSLWSW